MIERLIKSLASVLEPPAPLVDVPPQEPVIIEKPPYDEETTNIILSFSDKACEARNFEEFVNVLDEVITKTGLNPLVDLTYIAGILNNDRVARGLKPL